MNTMSSAYDTAEKIIQDHKDGRYRVIMDPFANAVPHQES